MAIKRKLTSVATAIMAVIMLIPSLGASAFEFTPTSGTNDKGEPIPLKLYSESAYMVNLDTGECVVNVDADKARVPASLTKIMTAVVLLDKFKDDPDEMKKTYVSAGTEAFDELYDTGASTADIQPNEKVNYYDLLAALMIPSACEAANIIAINVGGSINKFCDMMNKKAEELKMTNTHFSNAHGLFANKNYTSCKDLAKLCKYALDNYPVFKEIVSMPTYQMEKTSFHEEGSWLVNTNFMLDPTSKYYYQYVKGIKTGTLDSAGRCLASYATFDGNTYMIVTMGAPLEKTAEDTKKGEEDVNSVYADETVYHNLLDHIALYEWAFNDLVSTDFVNTSSEITEASIKYGKDYDYVTLKPAQGFTRLWPKEIPVEEVEQKLTVADNIVAPIKKGDTLGKMELVYDGEVLSTIDLVATSDVELAAFKAKLHVAAAFFKSIEFKAALFVIITLILIYTIIYIIRSQKKYLK